ncbi:cell differentiation Rcd1 [Tubulinosema ratisbonensis]|uniref:Cell differentiation Rcd1 n=1 Tax=Tubulinosema ratisbonensis TaxID=291195 RepID=A0A437ALX3_9MICR|nr:cell differentiation Rcd1 [Tubulinosema ratisbonensis]
MNVNELVKNLFTQQNRYSLLKETLDFLSANPSKIIDFWHTDGVPIFFLQELTNIYEVLDSDKLKNEEISYTCMVMNVLKLIATNKEVRNEMIKIQLPFYLYPYMNNPKVTQKYELLRISALSYLDVFVETPDKSVVTFFKKSELIPLSLKCMDIGSVISKILASKIFLFILKEKEGLEYAVQTLERFVTIGIVLNVVLGQCVGFKSPELIRNILECYCILVTEENVKLSFKNSMPKNLTDERILSKIKNDEVCRDLFQRFYSCVNNGEFYKFD